LIQERRGSDPARSLKNGLSRHLAADGKFVDEVVGLVSVVDGESGDVVAVAHAVVRLCFFAQYVKILVFFDRGIIP
jgi:hypothetical protein